MTEEVSLYDRIGGAPAVAKLIDRFYKRVFDDPELEPFFHNTSVDKLLCMQKEFFSTALDGPQTYTGRPLAHVHHGLGIRRRHFARVVTHLLETLEEIGVSEEDTSDVIARVNTYVDDIVGGHGFDG